MTTAVVATMLNAECRIPEGLTDEEILKAVFKQGKNHWMASTEGIAFDASIAVAYTKMSEAGKVRMKASTDTLKALNAMFSGVPVNLEAVLEANEGIETFPLTAIWKET